MQVKKQIYNNLAQLYPKSTSSGQWFTTFISFFFFFFMKNLIVHFMYTFLLEFIKLCQHIIKKYVTIIIYFLMKLIKCKVSFTIKKGFIYTFISFFYYLKNPFNMLVYMKQDTCSRVSRLLQVDVDPVPNQTKLDNGLQLPTTF